MFMAAPLRPFRDRQTLLFGGGGASVNTNWNRITWTASAEFVWIPCKETQKMTVHTKKFLLSFLSV